MPSPDKNKEGVDKRHNVVMSTGRGGAGNIGSDVEQSLGPSAKSLETPHIKKEHYTTGRGGTGNMAYNHPSVPEMARASQDVHEPPARTEAPAGTKVLHGRGGAANYTSAADSGLTVDMAEDRGRNHRERRPSQSLAEKGKDFLDRLRSRSGRRAGD